MSDLMQKLNLRIEAKRLVQLAPWLFGHHAAKQYRGRQQAFEDIEITQITADSRKIIAGTLFCALSGENVNAAEYAQDALNRGAALVFVESYSGLSREQVNDLDALDNVFLVSDLAKRLSQLAAAFYDFPSRDPLIIGITGTNGKTSVANFTGQLAAGLGFKVGVIGTLGMQLTSAAEGSSSKIIATGNTTPMHVELQACLRYLVDAGCGLIVMEVSSHALAQYRADAVDFDVAVFTNLSHDHLDYHKTMDAYFNAKTRLFSLGRDTAAVINASDEYGQQLLACMPEARAYPFAQEKSGGLSIVDLTPADSDDADTVQEGLNAVIGGERFLIASKLSGRITLLNLEAALSAIWALKERAKLEFDTEELAVVIGSVKPVSGRLEPVVLAGDDRPRQDISVYVDYAHTPDALEQVLNELKAGTANGALICVFGCGGERDNDKRPLMGLVAERTADVIYLTNDNPRSENPKTIADQVLSSVKSRDAVVVELDRERAIAKAILAAESGDCVLLAGKGHEDYQELMGDRVPFSDVEVAERYLAQRCTA